MLCWSAYAARFLTTHSEPLRAVVDRDSIRRGINHSEYRGDSKMPSLPRGWVLHIKLTGTPRDGFNPALRRVGKTYGVTKDPRAPHWSSNGQ